MYFTPAHSWVCIRSFHGVLYSVYLECVLPLSQASAIIICIFLHISDASLEWETIEQYFLWQFITAHDIPAEQIIPILPKLEYIGKRTIQAYAKCNVQEAV